MDDVVFEVVESEKGGYDAHLYQVGGPVQTHGDDWENLCLMVVDAVRAYFAPGAVPPQVMLKRADEQAFVLEIPDLDPEI